MGIKSQSIFYRASGGNDGLIIMYTYEPIYFVLILKLI